MDDAASITHKPGLGLPSRHKRRRAPFSMTALADVLFQLLIFFMLSSNLSAYSLLPLRAGAIRGDAQEAPAAPETAVTETGSTAIWTLNTDGIVASGQRFGIDRLPSLADALALRQTQHVLIILRPEVPVQDIVTVLEVLSARGIGSVQIAEAPGVVQRATPAASGVAASITSGPAGDNGKAAP